MGTYEDVDWAWLRALTRERRRDRRVLRYSRAVLVMVTRPNKRPIPLKTVWRRAEWEAGNRECAYCGVAVLSGDDDIAQNHPCRATTDHRVPLAADGRDDPSNYLMACWMCNHRKGTMPEADFRALLAAERRLDLTG